MIEDMKLGDVVKLAEALKGSGSDTGRWQIGEAYFIRTVTHHLTGRLIAVTDQELWLKDAAWIADDGRYTQAIADGAVSEVEPYPDGEEVPVGRGSLIDAVRWRHDLPREQK